jgi:hypothetical protein
MEAKGYGSFCLRYVKNVKKSVHSSSESFFGYVKEKFAKEGVRKNPQFALNAPIFQRQMQ